MLAALAAVVASGAAARAEGGVGTDNTVRADQDYDCKAAR